MKRNDFLALVLLAALFSIASFIVYLSPLSNYAIHGGATSETATLSVTIAETNPGLIVPISGTVIPNNSEVASRVNQVANLTPAWAANITLFGGGFPGSWTETQPNSSQAGNNTIEYFEIVINASTAGGSYKIYFNVTEAELAGVHPNNISLFIFDTVWTNLSTIVVNASTNPRQFYGITPHFSKFLIAQTPVSSSEESAPVPGATTAATGGGGGSTIKKPGEPVTETPGAKPETVKPILQPVHKPGILFDVSVTIPDNYRQVLAGEILIAEIKLINIKKIGLVPVKVEYSLQDTEGNLFFHIYETKTIENEITFIKEMALPADLQAGEYLFYVKVDYAEDTALAGYPFEVIEEPLPLIGLAAVLGNPAMMIMAIPIMVVLVITIIVLLCLMHLKNKRLKNKSRSRR